MRWLIVLALGFGVTVARADDAADRDEARREFAAGQAADRQRDWTQAIEHYLRANDLVPHPNAMFNIATDYERLGKLREAAIWYQRYLDQAQDSPDRDKVVRALRDLQAKPGTLTVRSKPTGARVLVDNKFAGLTPYSDHIKGGAHRVTVELDGRREEREVKIEFGEPEVLDVEIRNAPAVRDNRTPNTPRPRVEDGARPETVRATGTLRISGPQGAVVMIDNQVAGTLETTEPLALPIEAGPHNVRVTQVGFAPYVTAVDVYPNQDTEVAATMQRDLGTVDQANAIKVAYLAGGGAGIDARGNGELFLLELGVRALQYDVSARIGKTAGLTAIDLLVRWSLTKGRVAPFVSIGYSFVGEREESASASPSASAGGYLLTGGLRFDLSRGEHYGMSLIAESGIRYYSGLDLSEPGEATRDESGLIVPLMTSLQITYK